jgi:hypothetical protein
MTNPEFIQNSEELELLTHKQAFDFLNAKIESWDFSEHDDQDNIDFAFHVGYWAEEVFGYHIHYRSDEFEGEELPTSLQPLVSHNWKDESFLVGHNTVSVNKTPEQEYIPAKIPKWEELQEIGVFEKMVEVAINDPEIHEHIIFPKVIEFPAVRIDFEHVFDWGIGFTIRQNSFASSIEMDVFGKNNETTRASRFLQSNHDRPSVLAKTSAELALLAAKYTKWSVRPMIDPLTLINFDLRMMGLDSVRLSNSIETPPGHAIQELFLNRLIEMGKIEPPE